METITVAIADSDPVKRTACEYLLRYEEDIQVVAQIGSSRELLPAILDSRPRVLLCKFSLAAVDGFSVLRALHGDPGATRVLLLTDRSVREEPIIEALNLGARGYLGAESMMSQVAKVVRRIHEGEVWMPRAMLGRVLDRAILD